jgi:hypothetical protein
MDYPFTSWSAYFAALTESLSTEFYGETYPKYAKQHDGKTEDDEIEGVDYNIVSDLLSAGLDAQEGLDGFMQAILDGSRYASELCYIDEILSLFTDAGAKPKIDTLFEPLYADEPQYFEDEMYQYTSRGILIDGLSEFIDGKKYYDWSSIKATYWEKIDKNIIKTDYKKACYMYLKHTSAYLQTL